MSLQQQGLIEIDPLTAKNWLEKGEAILVDVREEEEHAEEHLNGALLLPMSDFEPEQFPTNTGKKVIVYCLAGVRSAAIGRKMLTSGQFVIFNLTGGIRAWKAAELPTVKP